MRTGWYFLNLHGVKVNHHGCWQTRSVCPKYFFFIIKYVH